MERCGIRCPNHGILDCFVVLAKSRHCFGADMTQTPEHSKHTRPGFRRQQHRTRHMHQTPALPLISGHSRSYLGSIFLEDEPHDDGDVERKGALFLA